MNVSINTKRNKYRRWTIREENMIIEFMKNQGLQLLADKIGVDYWKLMSKLNYMRKQGKFNVKQ